jgi:quinol monooxygenase YgiN
MYARSTTIHGNPAALEVGIAYVREAVMPDVRAMAGSVGLSMLTDRESGRSIITSSWADSESMHRSAAYIDAVRNRTAEILCGSLEVQEWEISVLHRHSSTGHGRPCARVAWTRGDPAHLDDMTAAFRMTMVDRFADLPGFCSVSVMVDRSTGQCATTTTYESRHALELAMERSVALRREFAKSMHMQLEDAASFDLVLAQLHVPETV